LDTRTVSDDYWWQPATVALILARQEYLGHTVNFKTYRKSYKQKKKLQRAPSEWQIFKNTHDLIITQETFDIVQRLRENRRKLTPAGAPNLLAGMLYCADCGRKMYQARARSRKRELDYFICSSCRKARNGCTSHSVCNILVEENLLQSLQSVTAYAREHEDEFVAMVTKKSKASIEKTLMEATNIDGKVSDERFARMSANYGDEQKALENRLAELQNIIMQERDCAEGANRFLAQVRKYTDIKELDSEVVHEFVDRIVVHDKQIIDGKKSQEIRILWNCIGEFVPPKDSARRRHP